MNWKKYIPAIAVVSVIVVTIVTIIIVNVSSSRKKSNKSGAGDSSIAGISDTGSDEANSISSDIEMKEDPQYSDNDSYMNPEAGNGAKVTLSNSTNETDDVSIGIDVSKFQGTINWTQVSASVVDLAMILFGFRAHKKCVIYADTNARYNMQQAAANGIKVGAYFFSSAVNEAEA